MLRLFVCMYVCRHVCLSLTTPCIPQRPHSVTVLHLGQEPKIKLVQCLEPQRLYDLMKAHDISCTTVWNSRISLSALAPCKALCDYDMAMVRVNMSPAEEALGDTSPVPPFFYHNMKHIQLRSRRKALRCRPYEASNLPLVELQRRDPSGMHTDIGVALYYGDSMSTVEDVIKADGRFLPTARIANGTCDIAIMEVEAGSVITAGRLYVNAKYNNVGSCMSWCHCYILLLCCDCRYRRRVRV